MPLDTLDRVQASTLKLVPPRIVPPDAQLPYLRALRTMLDNPMEGWPRAIYEELFYVPPRRDFPTIYVCDPDALRAVLVERAADFPKSPLWLKLLKPLLGEAILTASGDHWRWQRQAAAPTFQPAAVTKCAEPIIAAAERAAARWARARPDQPLDIAAEMIRITFDVILDTVFDGRAAYDCAEMSAQFALYLHELGKPTIADLLGAPAWLRRLTAPGATKAIAYLRGEIDRTIVRRRAAPERDDLIGRLMRARDPESGRTMSDADLRDNLLTFLAGGHETTALALTWSIFLLSCDQETQVRVRTEARAALAAGPLDAEALARLPFTRQVVQEAVRLYPPVPVLTRTCLAPCTIGGREIGRGDIIVIPIYALHRHQKHWRDPDSFDPARFEPGAGVDKRRYVYMPFGGGPRVCIGSAFAIMEATLILARLAADFAFERDPRHPIRPLLRITMRPEGGLPTFVRKAPASDLSSNSTARHVS